MKIFNSIIVTIIILIASPSDISAQDKTDEVIILKKMVISKLNKLKNDNASEYADRELIKIENYLKLTDKFLNDGDNEKAFYSISIAIVYFNLIEAKKQLYLTKNKLAENKKE